MAQADEAFRRDRDALWLWLLAQRDELEHEELFDAWLQEYHVELASWLVQAQLRWNLFFGTN